MQTLNELYSRTASRRRYEVWFLRLGLADHSGAWWFRYLLMNPGRGGCTGNPDGLPFQVWAAFFPQGQPPRSFIQGFSLDDLQASARLQNPFHLAHGRNAIGENSCRGLIQAHGHEIAWTLQYESTFRTTLSNKGWIGFSRTPHSNAVFSGEIRLDDRVFRGAPLGFGVQGHNCGYRHRNYWSWTHAFFPRANGNSTFEALTYEMPFGLRFRKAVLWHEGVAYVMRKFQESRRDRRKMLWNFEAAARDISLSAEIDGSGVSVHRLPYVKTGCTGTFEVANNSLARAKIVLRRSDHTDVLLTTEDGAVLEMVGS